MIYNTLNININIGFFVPVQQALIYRIMLAPLSVSVVFFVIHEISSACFALSGHGMTPRPH
jgi:hypothetical protein